MCGGASTPEISAAGWDPVRCGRGQHAEEAGDIFDMLYKGDGGGLAITASRHDLMMNDVISRRP